MFSEAVDLLMRLIPVDRPHEIGEHELLGTDLDVQTLEFLTACSVTGIGKSRHEALEQSGQQSGQGPKCRKSGPGCRQHLQSRKTIWLAPCQDAPKVTPARHNLR